MAKRVLTITLNPTVDKSCEVENIKPEKKLRCSQPLYEPGGGGINVSRGLSRLGVPSIAFFTSGGRTGKKLEELLGKEGIEVMAFDVAAETRENFIVVDSSNNEQYRFGMPGEEISNEEADAMRDKLLNLSPFPDIVVISGSLPPGISPNYLRSLVKALKAKQARVVLDTSGEALSEAIEEGVYLLKPNLGELSRLADMGDLDNESADEAARQLIDEGKARAVVVSMGPQGAYLVTGDDTIHVPAPSVKKRSTVGAGDSMVAGMVAIMAESGSMADMVRMGVACGTAATMSKGTGLFTKEDAEKLYKWLTKNI